MQEYPQVDKHKVVVLSTTYNQSKYIEETLNGFAIQKTNFPFLCCVFDDASNDGEQKVLRDWVINHCRRGVIETYDSPLATILMATDRDNCNCKYVFYLQKINTWRKPEKDELLDFWKQHGEYIAFCEGDDYWIDPLKLQKQVNFLDENPEYAMVYTNAKKYYQNKRKLVGGRFGQRNNSFDSLLIRNPIPTLTVMYREDIWEEYCHCMRPFERSWLQGDYPLWLWMSTRGKIKFLSEFSGVYRVLDVSASHFKDYESAKRFLLSSISVKKLYARLFNVANMDFVEDSNCRNLLTLAFHYREYEDLCLSFGGIKHKSIKDRLKFMIGYVGFRRKLP